MPAPSKCASCNIPTPLVTRPQSKTCPPPSLSNPSILHSTSPFACSALHSPSIPCPILSSSSLAAPTMLREALLTVPEADALFTPPSSYSPQKTLARLDLRFDSNSDDSLDGDIFNMNTMAGTGSPSPYIKEELDDMHFNPNRFMGHSGLGMTQQFGNQEFSGAQDNMGAINPSDLSVSGNFLNNNQFGTGYMPGGAGIADDELADSLGNFDHQQNFGGFNQEENYLHAQPAGAQVPRNHAAMHQLYSNTPDDLPIQSPFTQPQAFDFSQYQSPSQRLGFAHSMPNGAISRQRMAAAMSRNGSDSRSPMSPKGHTIGAGQFGTPDSGNFGSQPIMTTMHRRQKSVGGTWDGTPGSSHSWIESPAHSPHTATLPHQQISEVMHSAKHASLPAKVDLGQSQDAKKRRRRESHNLVERRRRDNINERIQDLSRLVPQHRLEDEKIRKHINNNGPLSPALTSGMSPPQATSLLAGGTGKRAAGNITTGLPIEEKDKGPNKGDILNGAVSWTRDLMWMLYRQIKENDALKARLGQQGWVSEETEEERRMRTELVEAVEKNGVDSFKYSRGPGSGLRVPKHTNLAGEPIGQISPQSLSPGMQSNGSSSNVNAGDNANANQQFWMSQQTDNNPFTLKEEDEYNSMDMG
ncbi:uncharacterized protein EI97DRAFT_50048 [Westerdykella ornata]|uniref:BHLH domain-containing protein n=1 Tax=Westerdykella ornata TaxID=318751 RepID=A0A6A6JJG3_WESOR|nr:uncharacterized protein EI97DRAFT_50048 [Westerdykella ornata]KAF2276128.1 hypothetical protein EI97DRAFT_50048 [Westerdykella ornata]